MAELHTLTACDNFLSKPDGSGLIYRMLSAVSWQSVFNRKACRGRKLQYMIRGHKEVECCKVRSHSLAVGVAYALFGKKSRVAISCLPRSPCTDRQSCNHGTFSHAHSFLFCLAVCG